jgi:hypothetical protein
MANLSPAEMAQLKAAHDKAITQDPTLNQKMKAAHDAMESARQAMHDAMIKVDPSVEPILEKMAPKKWEHGLRPGAQGGTNASCTSCTNALSTNSGSMMPWGKREGHGMPPGFASLTPDEQAQLKAAHEKVKNDPAVVAAKAAEKSATTPQDRRAAREALHKAVHDAMLKADPTIEPLLEKLHPQGPSTNASGGTNAAGPGGEGAPMPPPPQ